MSRCSQERSGECRWTCLVLCACLRHCKCLQFGFPSASHPRPSTSNFISLHSAQRVTGVPQHQDVSILIGPAAISVPFVPESKDMTLNAMNTPWDTHTYRSGQGPFKTKLRRSNQTGDGQRFRALVYPETDQGRKNCPVKGLLLHVGSSSLTGRWWFLGPRHGHGAACAMRSGRKRLSLT